MSGGTTTGVDRVRWVLFGAGEPRLRATWRLLLAVPLLPLVGALVALVMPLLGLRGMIPGGPTQGVVFLVLLLVWARYVDRRPLGDYGVSWSRSWLASLLVGFLVVVTVWGGWHVLAASLGWTRIEVAMTAPGDSLAFGLVGVLVSLAINTWVQDVVFFGVVLAGAAEGFRARGLAPVRAVAGGWLVATTFFTAIHGTPTVPDLAGTVVGGAVFGLLYVHTGELALTIGVHWGSSFAAGTAFAAAGTDHVASIFEVGQLQPGVPGEWVAVPLYLATYVLLVAWLRLTRGDLAVETDVARWPGRPGGQPSSDYPTRDG